MKLKPAETEKMENFRAEVNTNWVLKLMKLQVNWEYALQVFVP